MSKDKVCLIINPISGKESKRFLPEEFASSFDQSKYDIFIRITGYAGHATEIAKEAVRNNYKFIN